MSDQFVIPRRSFLGRCSMAGACAVGALDASLQAQSPASEVAVRGGGRSPGDFRPLVGSRFYVEREPGRQLAVELIEVSTMEVNRPPGHSQPFLLIFRVPGNSRLPQDVYKVTHPELGTARYLLVPVDLPENHNRLQVAFG